MDHSLGKMIAKIAFGLFCILAMFRGEQEGATIAAGAVIGLAFIAWGIVPWLSTRRNQKLYEERRAKKEQAELDRIEAQKKAEAERPKTCSHCGAATKGNVCEYCGSPLDN